MMAAISFRAKPETVYTMDGAPAFQRIRVPVLTRAHCDMAAFRKHPKYGGLANSDLFKNVLARLRRDFTGDYIRLDRVPEGVTLDTSGFLATVTLEV
jgi:hypothetical protein